MCPSPQAISQSRANPTRGGDADRWDGGEGYAVLEADLMGQIYAHIQASCGDDWDAKAAVEMLQYIASITPNQGGEVGRGEAVGKVAHWLAARS